MPSPPRQKPSGGFPTTRGPKYRADLDISVDSRWEANLARILEYLRQRSLIAGWRRPGLTLLFPKGDEPLVTGNRHIKLDFAVTAWQPDARTWGDPDFAWLAHYLGQLPPDRLAGTFGTFDIQLEVKGRLPVGGLLDTYPLADLTVLDQHGDADSGVKLRNLKRAKAYQNLTVVLIGDQDYARLTREWRDRIPAWES